MTDLAAACREIVELDDKGPPAPGMVHWEYVETAVEHAPHIARALLAALKVVGAMREIADWIPDPDGGSFYEVTAHARDILSAFDTTISGAEKTD